MSNVNIALHYQCDKDDNLKTKRYPRRANVPRGVMKEICRIKIGSCWEKGSHCFVSYVTVERKGKESASNYIKQTLSAFDDVNADYAARIVKKQTRMNRNLENYKCS